MRTAIVATLLAVAWTTNALAQQVQYFHAGIQIEVKPGVQEQEWLAPIGGFTYADVKQVSVRCYLNTTTPRAGVLLKIMASPNRNEALFVPVTPIFADSREGGQTYMTANIQPFYRFFKGAKYYLYGEAPDGAEGQCAIGFFGDLVLTSP